MVRGVGLCSATGMSPLVEGSGFALYHIPSYDQVLHNLCAERLQAHMRHVSRRLVHMHTFTAMSRGSIRMELVSVCSACRGDREAAASTTAFHMALYIYISALQTHQHVVCA